MILNGKPYFKEAYLKAASQRTLQKIALAIIKIHEPRIGGHDFNKNDLLIIDNKLSRRFK
jgi:hypothetical protein